MVSAVRAVRLRWTCEWCLSVQPSLTMSSVADVVRFAVVDVPSSFRLDLPNVQGEMDSVSSELR